MKILGWTEVEDFCRRHADARGQLDAWKCEVEDANWLTFNELKGRHPEASILPNNRIVFNIKGNDYRLLVKVSLKSNIVRVVKVGTHAEYSKWNLKES